jgi:hypothetical protein
MPTFIDDIIYLAGAVSMCAGALIGFLAFTVGPVVLIDALMGVQP